MESFITDKEQGSTRALDGHLLMGSKKGTITNRIALLAKSEVTVPPVPVNRE